MQCDAGARARADRAIDLFVREQSRHDEEVIAAARTDRKAVDVDRACEHVGIAAVVAPDAFRDVADTFGDAIEDSLKRRPYATLAMVAGIGFLFGAAWRR